MTEPTVKRCPYCGSRDVPYVQGVSRCYDCRAVFFVQFSRYTRQHPAKGEQHERTQNRGLAGHRSI